MNISEKHVGNGYYAANVAAFERREPEVTLFKFYYFFFIVLLVRMSSRLRGDNTMI